MKKLIYHIINYLKEKSVISDNAVIEEEFRKSLDDMLLEYPKLKGAALIPLVKLLPGSSDIKKTLSEYRWLIGELTQFLKIFPYCLEFLNPGISLSMEELAERVRGFRASGSRDLSRLFEEVDPEQKRLERYEIQAMLEDDELEFYALSDREYALLWELLSEDKGLLAKCGLNPEESQGLSKALKIYSSFPVVHIPNIFEGFQFKGPEYDLQDIISRDIIETEKRRIVKLMSSLREFSFESVLPDNRILNTLRNAVLLLRLIKPKGVNKERRWYKLKNSWLKKRYGELKNSGETQLIQELGSYELDVLLPVYYQQFFKIYNGLKGKRGYRNIKKAIVKVLGEISLVYAALESEVADNINNDDPEVSLYGFVRLYTERVELLGIKLSLPLPVKVRLYLREQSCTLFSELERVEKKAEKLRTNPSSYVLKQIVPAHPVAALLRAVVGRDCSILQGVWSFYPHIRIFWLTRGGRPLGYIGTAICSDFNDERYLLLDTIQRGKLHLCREEVESIITGLAGIAHKYFLGGVVVRRSLSASWNYPSVTKYIRKLKAFRRGRVIRIKTVSEKETGLFAMNWGVYKDHSLFCDEDFILLNV